MHVELSMGRLVRAWELSYIPGSQRLVREGGVVASMRMFSAIFTTLILSAFIAGVGWAQQTPMTTEQPAVSQSVSTAALPKIDSGDTACTSKKCPGDDHAEFHHHGTDLRAVGALGLQPRLWPR
jgi:hypothetical protein